MEKIMIVVPAATGEFGRLVVDQLLNRVPASAVAVAVRHMHKAADLADRGVQVRYADYDEPDSLRDSFDGADRLLFISAPSSDSGERMRQHHNVVDAARTSGVGHLLYTSGWEPMSSMKADWPTTTPLNGPSGTVVCRTRSCGTRSIRSGSSIQVCGSR
jgi:uncharacterized protein YbjT (DUF2867 family)